MGRSPTSGMATSATNPARPICCGTGWRTRTPVKNKEPEVMLNRVTAVAPRTKNLLQSFGAQRLSHLRAALEGLYVRA